ncbi:hypothetical protein QBC43DRAFT_321524 [Cladorrhinum sp. PSN259]|nr:hypothetical protein QBC43DRAFT_321524 [Cladorrhinum sp. PSN259]
MVLLFVCISTVYGHHASTTINQGLTSQPIRPSRSAAVGRTRQTHHEQTISISIICWTSLAGEKGVVYLALSRVTPQLVSCPMLNSLRRTSM